MNVRFNSTNFRILRYFAQNPGKPGVTLGTLTLRVSDAGAAIHQRITELRDDWKIPHHVVDGEHRYYVTHTEARRMQKKVTAITSAHLSRRMKEAA